MNYEFLTSAFPQCFSVSAVCSSTFSYKIGLVVHICDLMLHSSSGCAKTTTTQAKPVQFCFTALVALDIRSFLKLLF